MMITFVISKLGLGHLTRQIALSESCQNFNQNIQFQFVISDFHRDHFGSYFDSKQIKTYTKTYSPGFAFSPPNQVDIDSTLYSYQMAIDFDTQIRDDTTWGQILENTTILVNDIDFFHNPIAVKMGIPIVNISNFTWSDLLEPFNRPSLTEKIIEFEKLSTYNIKLPFSTECASFQDNYEELGLLARKPDLEMSESIKANFSNSKKIILFLSLDPNFENSLEFCITQLNKNYNIIIPYSLRSRIPNENSNKTILTIPKSVTEFQNYIQAADLVINKTGYGTVSECVSTGTPMLFWTREDFLEDEVLSNALEKRSIGLRMGSKLNNKLLDKIDHLIHLKPKIEPLGNDRIAQRILQIL
ncbi:MAG: glycosyltransferase [Candidatus Kariarchaeaceae archaeon]